MDRSGYKIALTLGACFFVPGFIWGFIAGYYPSDAWKVWGLLIIGAVLLSTGIRAQSRAKQERASKQATRIGEEYRRQHGDPPSRSF